MSLTVVGSIAFDAVETPTGKRDRLLGGAAVHFSLASSFLAETRVVGPVGDDFGPDEYAVLHDRGVITDDIEHVPGGKTFFWAGPLRARPERPPHAADRPQRVRALRAQALGRLARGRDACSWPTSIPTSSAPSTSSARPRAFVAMDTMNLWIDVTRDVARADDRRRRLPDRQRRRGQAAHRRAEPRARRARRARDGPARGDRQAGRARRRHVHARRLLRPARLPDRRRRRPDRRRRHLRGRLHGLRRRPRRRGARPTSCCAARSPTAPRWPPSTSRRSAPSGCRR